MAGFGVWEVSRALVGHSTELYSTRLFYDVQNCALLNRTARILASSKTFASLGTASQALLSHVALHLACRFTDVLALLV